MKATILALLGTLAVGSARAATPPEPVTLENAGYRIRVEAGGTFSLQAQPSGKPFLTAGTLPGGPHDARRVELQDPVWGAGAGIELTGGNGDSHALALYPGLPFVVIQTTLRQGGSASGDGRSVAGLRAALDLGIPPGEVRTLGTGGLLPPAQNPGSYAFLATVDPASRRGVVSGWLTHDRGSGVVFSTVDHGSPGLEARLDYGRLRINPGQTVQAERFAVGWFEDARTGLEAYADSIARTYRIQLPPQPAGYCTWYMEKHGGACDEVRLAELAGFAARQLRPFGFDFVQIDDGWQEGVKKNGPKKNFTTHAAAGPYPGGMKGPAQHLKRLGLTPGIWFMPFAGTHFDPYFQAHQDWFVKGPDGQPFETPWGGTSLDMTHPGAREHLRGIVSRIAHDWGYTLFKMDGLWTGSATRQIYVNDGYRDDAMGEAVFHDPGKTNIEAYRDGLRLVRQAAGPEVFLLGCCVSQNMRSFGGSFGLLDAMRVGPDTGAGHIGAPHASRLWFLNGRVWWNDPDCVSVRASTPLDQARLNATFTAIAGDLFYNSDWMPDLPPQRLDILRRCLPSHALPSRPVDVFENQPARIWHLTAGRGGGRRDVVALYNWEKTPVTVACAASRIGLPGAAEYVGFDFWADKFVPPFREEVRAVLPPGSCRVLALRPAADVPQVLSTSRHVCQGMLDVTEERWDPAAGTLSGRSQVVAGDSYELRIAVPVGESSWRASGFTVAADDGAAGVLPRFVQEGPKVRASLSSPVSREVRWSLAFAPGAIAPAPPPPVEQLAGKADHRAVSLSWAGNGAEGYRVRRDDGMVMDTSCPGFTDSSAPRGRTLRYQISSLGWRGEESAPATLEVITPAELKRPPLPPPPTRHLSDLQPAVQRIGWGRPGFDRSVEGKPLTIEGKVYAKGLGLHAHALVTCAVPAGARRFVAVAGLDDEKRADPRSSVTFEVYGDVKEMGEAPVLLAQSPPLSSATLRSWAFDVEWNSRHREVRLVISGTDDGIAADHADWVDAGFLLEEGPSK